MTEEAKAETTAETTKVETPVEGTTESVEELKKKIAILNSENAERRIKLDKFKEAQKAEEERLAAEKGEFKELYESLKAETEGKDGKITAYEGALNKLLESEMANIPEAMHALIPSGDISTKLEWIATAKAAKLFDPAKGPDLRESGEFKSGTLEAKLEQAKKDGNLSAQISIKKQIFDKQHPN